MSEKDIGLFINVFDKVFESFLREYKKMADSKSARYSYISFAKALGIMGVSLYHCILFFSGNPFVPMQADRSSIIVKLLNPFFDMIFVPGFMFCSGFLFAKGTKSRKRNFGQTLWERAGRLLIPYYIVGTFWLVPMYTIFDVPCFGRPEHAGYFEGLKAMALGQFSDHLWFLWGLFWTVLVFALLLPLCREGKYHPYLFVIVTIVGVLEYYFINQIPYFKLFSAGSYNWVFFAGMVCYFYRYHFFQSVREKIWLFFILDAILCVVLAAPSLLGTLSEINWTGSLAPLNDRLSDFSNQLNTIWDKVFILTWLKYTAGGFLLYLLAVVLERYGLMDQIFKTKFWDFTYRNNMELYLFNLPVPHLYFRLFYEILGLPVWPSILLITICFFPTLYLIVWLVSKPAALVRNLSDKLQGKKA